MPHTQPVILLAFADDPKDHLPCLDKEFDALYEQKLYKRRVEQDFDVFAIKKATPKKICDLFESRQGTVKVFHFSGHANSTVIQLNEANMFARGLKNFMEGVELIVLNGCATRKQVKEFMEVSSVKAIIATRVEIRDDLAYHFADRLYQKLDEEALPLYLAFRDACKYVNSLSDSDIMSRSLFMDDSEEDDVQAVDWELWLKNDQAKFWKLNDIVPKEELEGLPKDDKQKLEARFLKLESFQQQRRDLIELLYEDTDHLHAFGCIIHGEGKHEAYGQHWIAGNLFSVLLRDRIDTLNISAAWNLSVKQVYESSGLFKALYKQLQPEYAFLTGTEKQAKQTLKNICDDLLNKLKLGPIIIRIKDDLDLHLFPQEFSAFAKQWETICRVIDMIHQASQAEQEGTPKRLLPFVFLLVQENGQSSPPPESIIAASITEAVKTRKPYCLAGLTALKSQTFIQWIDKEIDLFNEPLLKKLIDKKKEEDKWNWFSKEEKEAAPIDLMNCICEEFDYEMQFNDGRWFFNKKAEENEEDSAHSNEFSLDDIDIGSFISM